MSKNTFVMLEQNSLFYQLGNRVCQESIVFIS